MGQAGPGVRWRALTAAGALLVAGLAGCDGGDAPSPAPLEPLTSSASPTEPSESPAPTLPAEASQLSREGAKAFTRYLFEIINHAFVTGDSGALRGVSLKRCQSCEAIADNVDTIYSRGGHVETKGWELQSITRVPTYPQERPVFDLGVFRHPEHIYKPNDETPTTEGNQKQPMTLYLRWIGDVWRVARLDLVPT